MRQMKRRALALILCVFALLVGVLPSHAEKLRIFAGSSPVFAPVFVAEQQGFFKAERLDVVVRPFTSGAEATEGFRSGAAEFLVASDVPLIYLLAGGDTVMLAQFSANPDMLLIIGPKGMSGPAEMKGKKVGLVTKSASEYLLNNYLRRAGMNLSDIERVNLAPFDQVPALVRGDVFALSSWAPFDLKIAQIGGDKYATASWNGREGYILFSGIIAKNEFVQKNPEDTVKILKALIKASDHLKQNDLKTVSAELARYLKTSTEDVQHVIANNKWDMTVGKDFLATMTTIEVFLADQKLITKRVNWDTAYHWAPLKGAAPNLVP
jgi:NitT/TauT family transport system substrate-binding protein